MVSVLATFAIAQLSRKSTPPMLIIGIILIVAGIALIGTSVPGLFASQAFTAYNYYEDNPDVNGLLGLMSLGALVVGLGAVLFAKAIRVKNEASKGL